MLSQNWNTTSPSQWSTLSAQNIDHDLGHTSESRDASTSSLPRDLPVPTIQGETSKRQTSPPAGHRGNVPITQQDLADSALRRVRHATEDILLALDKIRNSRFNVCPSLSKFVHVGRDRFLTAVVVTCCAVSLFEWALSFTWDVIFKHFITLLLASFPLSVWFEREYRYHRQLDDIYERLEALQHHVASLQLNSEILEQINMEGIIRRAIHGSKRRANRWVAISTRRNGRGVGGELPEIVERKVKGLLNKLTMERFDSISDQIIEWANKSEKEKDGRTLIQIIKLVFVKATDEEIFSEMYARLCRKMMEQISSKVQDDGIKNAEGKPFAGGHLFRKYLLNRCQEDFERGWGWVAKDTTATAAATKATEDQDVKEANEKVKGGKQSELYSGECYAAVKARRRGLGLIRFIGELFKMQMLTERIMHECIKKLLGNVKNPEEEEMESLCMLLTTVGSLLDTPKARAHLDVYFSRMQELTKNENVTARIAFLLQGVIDLRERKWVPRNAVATPTTIAQIHEVAVKEMQAQEADAYMRQNDSMSPGGSRRSGNRDAAEALLPDGSNRDAPSRQQPKAGGLPQFGKFSKATPISFGPASVFSGKKGTDPESHDLAPQWRRQPLLPRSNPVGEESKVSESAVSEDCSDDEAAGGTGRLTPATMSGAEAKAEIEEGKKGIP